MQIEIRPNFKEHHISTDLSVFFRGNKEKPLYTKYYATEIQKHLRYDSNSK